MAKNVHGNTKAIRISNEVHTWIKENKGLLTTPRFFDEILLDKKVDFDKNGKIKLEMGK